MVERKLFYIILMMDAGCRINIQAMFKNHFFESRWPIYVPGMTGCSNIEFYEAIYKAGCVPSIVFDPNRDDNFFQNLMLMSEIAPDRNFAVVLFQSNLRNPRIISAVGKARPKYIEYWPRIGATSDKPTREDLQSGGQGFSELENDIWCRNAIKHLKSHSRIIMRMFKQETSDQESLIDAYALKSKDSAGRYGFYDHHELLKMFSDTNKPLIPQGGIGTPEQVKELLDAGAAAVGIGTVFAASQESCLSVEIKRRLIQANSSEISQLDSRQNAIVVGKVPDFTPEDWNRHNSMMSAINTGQSGHIYVGTAVDHIREILSVKDIVRYLVRDLES
jgi:hypothetical protein